MSLTSQKQGEARTAQTTRQDGDIEALRQILMRQRHCEVTYEEAKEVGAALVEFYEVLAKEDTDESTD